jgi:hypothetical protein
VFLLTAVFLRVETASHLIASTGLSQPHLTTVRAIPLWNGPHKWVILRMTPTALLSYLSCKKHEGARASSTLLEGFDPVGNVNTARRNNVC